MRSRWLLIAGFLIAGAAPAPAVVPLSTDDADTIEPGKWQLNSGWQFNQTAAKQLSTFPVNLIAGLNSRGEIGLTFGFQSRDGSGGRPDTNDAAGVTDLLIASKWRVWQSADDKLKLSTRFDCKLPTASHSSALGSGESDAGVTLIVTRSWGETEIDSNLGYIALDVSNVRTHDDHWFFGQSVRRKLNNRWTLIGETFAIVPNSGSGGSSNFFFNAGAQLTLHENFLISGLIGTAAGHHSPDVTSYFGMTVEF